MRRLEIVHLRSPGGPIEPLIERIRESIDAEGDSAGLVTLYKREGLETDIAVHILHGETPEGKGPSGLGQRLASALRAFGLLKHTRWEEAR